MSYKVHHLSEVFGILYVNPSVVSPGFQVGGESFNNIFGVYVNPDWLVWGYDFQCCNDCGNLANLVQLGIFWYLESFIPWVILCKPDSAPAAYIQFAVVHAGSVGVHQDFLTA